MDDHPQLPHLNQRGEMHMVSVGDKAETERVARAVGTLETRADVIQLVREGTAPKGDVLAVARVAAVMAVKRTAEWIPLAHPIPITGVEVVVEPEECRFRVEVTVKTVGRTGVEMEALTGVSAALLTLYDMLKAQDRAMTIAGVQILYKSGGRSGTFMREDDR